MCYHYTNRVERACRILSSIINDAGPPAFWIEQFLSCRLAESTGLEPAQGYNTLEGLAIPYATDYVNSPFVLQNSLIQYYV